MDRSAIFVLSHFVIASEK